MLNEVRRSDLAARGLLDTTDDFWTRHALAGLVAPERLARDADAISEYRVR